MTLTHVDVYESGTEDYHTFRIPAIETAPDGSLIALAEARKYNGSDPGCDHNEIDLVCKRSTDGGNTWSKLTVVDAPGERWSACNPATVVDHSNGRIWLFHVRTKPDRSSFTSRPGTDDAQAWVRSSDDNGVTWSQPADVTRVARDYDHWACSVFGPGGAIQIQSGRLIAPMNTTTAGSDTNGQPVLGLSSAFVIFSDDHGDTWQRGGLLMPGENGGNENQLVELADGRLLMDVRQTDGPHRWLTTSSDGGQTWSHPRPGETVTRVACAIHRYSLKSAGDDRDRIVWTGPKRQERHTLVVRVSYDEGQTFGRECVICEDFAAYSDLTILKDKSVGVLWERGTERNYQLITFTRLDRAFLEPDGS